MVKQSTCTLVAHVRTGKFPQVFYTGPISGQTDENSSKIVFSRSELSIQKMEFGQGFILWIGTRAQPGGRGGKCPPSPNVIINFRFLAQCPPQISIFLPNAIINFQFLAQCPPQFFCQMSSSISKNQFLHQFPHQFPKRKVDGFAKFYDLENLKERIELWYNTWINKQWDDEQLNDLEMIEVLEEADTFHPAIQKAIYISLAQPCTTCTITGFSIDTYLHTSK